MQPGAGGTRMMSTWALAVFLYGLTLTIPLVGQEKTPPPQPAPSANAREPSRSAPPSEADIESAALEKAFSASPGDPQALIKNLEAFLEKYPHSPRREQVLRTIYRQALQGNDPRKAAATAEKLLEFSPDDPDLLGSLADLYSRQDDSASREKGIFYATRLIEQSEKLSDETRPSEVPAAQWPEVRKLLRATAYTLRGRIYARAGESQKAAADFEKSLAAYPTAQVAEELGDAAMQLGEAERAIDAYATAFIIPDKRIDEARRDVIRKKLGSAYLAKYHSEKGLGDLILARYDEWVRSFPERFAGTGRPNRDARDPYDFVLERLDGSPLKLSVLRGKILVLDFWATWCAPCRVEGKLLDQVRERFQGEKSVAFLAVNMDDNRAAVPKFVKEEAWKTPVVYAQGLEEALGVRALPTLLIFDGQGRVVFRQAGIDFESFVPTVEQKVRQALGKPGN